MSYPNQPHVPDERPEYGSAPSPQTGTPADGLSASTPPVDAGVGGLGGPPSTPLGADPSRVGTVGTSGTSGAGPRAREVADTAADEVASVADTASQAGGHVVETARQEASEVIDEARFQGRRLLDESLSEFRAQAGTGQRKLAELARELGSELETLAQASPDGMLHQYIGQARRASQDAAQWLDSREPDDVLDGVRRYAARNPVRFLAISAGVGFLGARILRGLQGAKADRESSSGTYQATGAYPAARRESTPGVVEPEARYEDLPGSSWHSGLGDGR